MNMHWTQPTLQLDSTFPLSFYFILCLLHICVALGFFMINVMIIERLQSSFTLPFSRMIFCVY
jgi:hypothetical protein